MIEDTRQDASGNILRDAGPNGRRAAAAQTNRPFLGNLNPTDRFDWRVEFAHHQAPLVQVSSASTKASGIGRGGIVQPRWA